MDQIDMESAAGGLAVPENLPRDTQTVANLGAKPDKDVEGKSGESESPGSFPGLLAAQKQAATGPAETAGEPKAGTTPGQLATNAVPVGTVALNVLGGAVEATLPDILPSQPSVDNPPSAALLAGALGLAKPEGELVGVNPALLGGGGSVTPLVPGTEPAVDTGQTGQGEQIVLPLTATGALDAKLAGGENSQQGAGEANPEQQPGQQAAPTLTYSPTEVVSQGTQTRADTAPLLQPELAEPNLDPVLQSTIWQQVPLPGGGETTSGEIHVTGGDGQAHAEPGQIRGQVLTQILNQITRPDSTTTGQERITLQLDPPSLGKVEVQLVTQGDKLIITFHAASPEVAAALREGADDLVEAIVAKGHRWSSVEVRQVRENAEGQDDPDDPESSDNPEHQDAQNAQDQPDDPEAQSNPDENPERQSDQTADVRLEGDRERRAAPLAGA